MKRIYLLAALCVLPAVLKAQEKPERLDSVVVSASRAGAKTPVSYTTVGKEELQAQNPSYSLPMALSLQPGVVTYNEGGTGLGNSAMTIRGSKGSQINVTLNGITLNDAESQEVFWVNIPALGSLISNVQVQRGLGTSASGAGAFGASINMNTAFVQAQPSASFQVSAGSYRTSVLSAAVSTGILPGGLYCNLAWNRGATDGYIRNAQVKSNSVFAVLGWLKGRNSLRLTYLMGAQVSGITWDGISPQQYAIDRTYNGAGEYIDDDGKVCYYPNQTDNYTQHHLQLNYTHAFSDRLTLSNTLNYTRGDGYDEYYRMAQTLSDYGIPATPSPSDLTCRMQMGNNLWVLGSNLRYHTGQLEVSGGISLSHYHGDHWGDVLWVKTQGGTVPYDWYSNVGLKADGSAFLRAEYRPLPWLNLYADLQYRHIRYSLDGVDDDWRAYGAQEADRFRYLKQWDFFNPKAGASAQWGAHRVYASAAIGHREPGRGDIKANVKGDGAPIEPEKMLDVEAGYAFTGERLHLGANLYLMEYWDMLLETGRLSSSGYAIKENVPRAWRRGVECYGKWNALGWLELEGNTCFSINQIADYTAFIPLEDYSDSHAVPYGRTTMLMSPGLTAAARITVKPWKGAQLAADGKYVGKQYLDSSMREEMAIPAYYTFNMTLGQAWDLHKCKLEVQGYVENLLNHLYFASGWRWESYDQASGTTSSYIGIYPQAPRNFCIKLRVTF